MNFWRAKAPSQPRPSWLPLYSSYTHSPPPPLKSKIYFGAQPLGPYMINGASFFLPWPGLLQGERMNNVQTTFTSRLRYPHALLLILLLIWWTMAVWDIDMYGRGGEDVWRNRAFILTISLFLTSRRLWAAGSRRYPGRRRGGAAPEGSVLPQCTPPGSDDENLICNIGRVESSCSEYLQPEAAKRWLQPWQTLAMWDNHLAGFVKKE